MIKPEWYAAVQQIKYKNWDYNLVGAIDGDYLQITFKTREQDGYEKFLDCERNIGHDVHDEDCYIQLPKYKSVTQYCRKFRLENRFTVTDIVKTAWMATLAAEEHEAREEFKYKGSSVFGPHVDIDVLADLMRQKKNLDLREEAMV